MHAGVRIWRPAGRPGLLAMHGTTTRYAVEPAGIYVFGLVLRGGFRAASGRFRDVVAPGDVVAWEPSVAHRGDAVGGRPWEARLLMLELPAVREIVDDPEAPLPDLELPRPVVRDAALAASFAALHGALAHTTSTLARDTLLLEWLRALGRRESAGESFAARRRAARSEPQLRRACEFLRDNLERNVSLAELAQAAGTSRFRVSRLFQAGFGMPPHRFQLAQRLSLARRLLERGVGPAEAAAQTGFFDQSHMHRHFRAAIGTTPARYAAALAAREPSESAA